MPAAGAAPRPLLDGATAASAAPSAGCPAYGVLRQTCHGAEQPGRYRPPRLAAALRRPMTKGLDPFDICTSHVERHNLSIRTFLRRFTRLALGFSKKLENLAAATAVYMAHYNFARVHGSLKATPAMKAGLT